jgi:hypothetical protein
MFNTMRTFFILFFLLSGLARAFQCDAQWPPLNDPTQDSPPSHKRTATSFGTARYQPLPWPRDANNRVPITFCYTNSSTYYTVLPHFEAGVNMIISALELEGNEAENYGHGLSFNVLYHKDEYDSDLEPIFCDNENGSWNEALECTTVMIQMQEGGSSSASVGYPAKRDQVKRGLSLIIGVPRNGEPDQPSTAHEVRYLLRL